MDIEAKKQALETLRLGFIGLMNIVMQAKSSLHQKQQALLRFDEGHMWLQNGIMSYVEEPQPVPMTANEPVQEPQSDPEPLPEHHAIGANGQEQAQSAVA
jgi:hypothetical protein